MYYIKPFYKPWEGLYGCKEWNQIFRGNKIRLTLLINPSHSDNVIFSITYNFCSSCTVLNNEIKTLSYK